MATHLSEPQQQTSSWKVACFPWFSPLKLPVGNKWICFPIIGVVNLCGSCHVVQFLLRFLQLSKQLTLIGGPSMVPVYSTMCSGMYSRERLFCVIALFTCTRGRVLFPSFVQSQSVWLCKSVKLNAVVWKRICQNSNSEACGSPHRVFNSISARPEENEYHFKPIHLYFHNSRVLH